MTEGVKLLSEIERLSLTLNSDSAKRTSFFFERR